MPEVRNGDRFDNASSKPIKKITNNPVCHQVLLFSFCRPPPSAETVLKLWKEFDKATPHRIKLWIAVGISSLDLEKIQYQQCRFPPLTFRPIVTGSQAKISKRRNFRSKISLTAAHHNKMVRMAV